MFSAVQPSAHVLGTSLAVLDRRKGMSGNAVSASLLTTKLTLQGNVWDLTAVWLLTPSTAQPLNPKPLRNGCCMETCRTIARPHQKVAGFRLKIPSP